MDLWLVLEIGKACSTSFRMKDGLFEETCDAVMIGKIEAET